MRRFRLYLDTMRHLEWHQVPARARLRAKRWAREYAPDEARRRRVSRLRTATPIGDGGFRLQPPAAASAEALDRRQALEAGRWTFLTEVAVLGRLPDWQAGAQSQLWRYHLHYFDDVLPLVECGDAGRRFARELIEDWIARNPCGMAATRDAWHPYVVSLRLVNWLLAIAAAPDAFRSSTTLDASLREQTVFVSDNLERDVGGNHLLKNLKAVAIAAVYWRTWTDIERTVDAFTRELEAQILLDGVHFERSPMYHCQVLADALEVAAVLVAAGRAVSPRLGQACARLQGALPRLVHPDGAIALLGDSAFDMAISPDELESLYGVLLGGPATSPLAARHRVFAALPAGAAALPGRVAFAEAAGPLQVDGAAHRETHSGIVKRVGGRLTLIADVGAACPDELPAHAQADTFTFELSVDRTRVVVDAGVSEYREGAWRAYARSTPAHNTVAVDHTDSTECWGSFRAARRARVRRARTGTHEGWQMIDAVHDGYRRLRPPVEHRRCFLLHQDGALVIRDGLEGHGTHDWAVHLHMHPEVHVAPGEASVQLRRGDVSLRVLWQGLGVPSVVTAATSPLQGWYSPRFGERIAAPVLVWTGSGTVPVSWALALVAEPRGAAEGRVQLTPEGDIAFGERRLATPRRAGDPT